MKLEVGKYYKSRDGRKWKCVHEYENRDDYYYVCVECGEGYCDSFPENGRFLLNGKQNGNDLICEWVEPVVREVEVAFWVTKEGSVRASQDLSYWGTPIAKVKVKFTEGEGL